MATALDEGTASWADGALPRLGDLEIRPAATGEPADFVVVDLEREHHEGDGALFGFRVPPDDDPRADYLWVLGGVLADGAVQAGLAPLTADGLGPWLAEQQARIERREAELAEQAAEESLRLREALGLVDVADVMRNGVPEPEMLPGEGRVRLARALSHLLYGPKETFKSWFALWQCAHQVRAGSAVFWVDKEMGREEMARRLVALGLGPEEVGRHFVYFEYPTLTGDADVRRMWIRALRDRGPALVVVDAHTEVLADSDLNENSAVDVQRWTNWYLTPARELGAATLVIDHTGNESRGRARGSGHKGNFARVELEVAAVKTFDRRTVGLSTVTVRKNSNAADLPEKGVAVSYRVGAEPTGEHGPDGEPLHRFVIEERPDLSDVPKAIIDEDEKVVRRAVEILSDEPGGEMSQKRLAKAIGGNEDNTIRVLKLAAADPSGPLRSRETGRAILYSLKSEGDGDA